MGTLVPGLVVAGLPSTDVGNHHYYSSQSTRSSAEQCQLRYSIKISFRMFPVYNRMFPVFNRMFPVYNRMFPVYNRMFPVF